MRRFIPFRAIRAELGTKGLFIVSGKVNWMYRDVALQERNFAVPIGELEENG